MSVKKVKQFFKLMETSSFSLKDTRNSLFKKCLVHKSMEKLGYLNKNFNFQLFKMQLFDSEAVDAFKKLLTTAIEERKTNKIHRPDMVQVGLDSGNI